MTTRMRLLVVGGLVASLGAGALAGCFSERDESTGPGEGECRFPVGDEIPGSKVVVIRRFAFGPSDIQIQAGDRVTWINCDEDSHTSTADEGEWSSPLLAPGDAFTQTFPQPGEFTYHCEPHPFMTGRVTVQ